MNHGKSCQKNEIANDANILSIRFVLTIRYAETKNDIFRSGLVVQGKSGRDKALSVHD